MKHTFEEACSSLGAYLNMRCADLNISESSGYVFTIQELTEKTDVDPRMLGKLRKHFKRALAQSMTPGHGPEFAISEQSCFGRAAIVVRRVKKST